MTNSRLTNTEKHAQLIDAGWRTRVDGRLRPPDPTDQRAYTLAAAWSLHAEHATTERDQSRDRSDRVSRIYARGAQRSTSADGTHRPAARRPDPSPVDDGPAA